MSARCTKTLALGACTIGRPKRAPSSPFSFLFSFPPPDGLELMKLNPFRIGPMFWNKLLGMRVEPFAQWLEGLHSPQFPRMCLVSVCCGTQIRLMAVRHQKRTPVTGRRTADVIHANRVLTVILVASVCFF